MSRPRKREANITFSKDQRDITDHEIARCFEESGGTIFFAPCGEAERFDAAVTKVLEKIWRPIGIDKTRWRLLVELRLIALYDEGVLQFGRRGNTVRMSERRMRSMLTIADNRAQSRGRPKAYRYGRRSYTNRRAFKPLAVY